MDIFFIIAQVFGILGIVTSVCSMQFKKRKHILIALLCLNLFSALNFVFLGSWPSAYICFFAIVEMIINFIFEKNNKTVPKLLVVLYIIINIALGSLAFTGPPDVIPIVCAILFCITILLKKEQRIRWVTLTNQIFWLIFDLIVGAYMFAVSNVLTIIFTGLAIYRYSLKHNKRRKK